MINAVMFVVMVIAAQCAKSTALFADSLDNLGDAMTYGLSHTVVAGSIVAKAKVAFVQGNGKFGRCTAGDRPNCL